MPRNVLIVENEPAMAESIRSRLMRAGFDTAIAHNAENAWQSVSVVLPDLILLNWRLTAQSGMSLADQLRADARTKYVPLILLGPSKPKGRVLYGSNGSMDGHVARPERDDKLIASISAVLRGQQIPRLTDDAVSIGGLSIDPATRRVFADREGNRTELHVGPTELRLLYFFMTHPGPIYSRTELLYQVWGDCEFLSERSVDSYVKRLRDSLRPGACDTMVEVVRGFGYRFEVGRRTAEVGVPSRNGLFRTCAT
jgi:two-component system phosphate regulon response regulator PhoB